MSPPARSSLALGAVQLAAALSGAAALAYEIVWSRVLVVPLGASGDAAAVVLAGFMLGTAAGAWLGGRWAVHATTPLHRYALLELLLAGWALVAPRCLGALAHIGSIHLGAPLAVGLRYAGALLLIALPCLAMGATLPLLVQALAAGGHTLRATVGLTYGANTLGAAAGAALVGFWAIGAMGLWASGALAAGAGTAAAALAMAAALVHSRSARGSAPPARAPQAGAAPPRAAAARLAIMAAATSGAVMLGCELVWARLLAFVFGHDTYAFSALLVTVLAGLGLGGLTHRLLARREPPRRVAVLLSALAVVLLASSWLAAALVIARGRDPFALGARAALTASPWLELWRELTYTPLMVLLPSVISGMLLPAACDLYGHGRAAHRTGSGQVVAMVLLANGAGAAVGALLTALVLLPLLGIEPTLASLALLTALVASRLVEREPAPIGRLRKTAAVAAPVLLTGALALAMPPALPRAMLLRAVGARHQQILLYHEGRIATVAVTRNRINGERQLFINAVSEVTTRLVHDQSFKLLGHLGPLLHREPRRAVMICLGAGLSAGAASLHRLERLDVVDLSAAVVRGARRFSVENLGVLDSPSFHFHVGDGRRFLLDSPGGYDLAIVDSTHPKAVDSWLLYTAELYRLLRSRLGPGGIAVQWLPLHGMSAREVRILVHTFASVFPQVTLWANVGYETYGQVAYLKLVGFTGSSLPLDYARLQAGLADPRVAEDLAAYGLGTPAALASALLAGPDAVARWTAGLPVQTDDHPIVPYLTRYSRGRRMKPALLLAVREPFEAWLGLLGPAAAAYRSELQREYQAQGWVIAGRLGRAVEVAPHSRRLQLYRARAHTTLPYYQALVRRYPHDAETLFVAATQLAEQGHPRQAETFYQRAHGLAPSDLRVALDLALSWRQLGDEQRALDALTALRAEHPRSAPVQLNLGAVLLGRGELGAAAAQLQAAVAADPYAVRARLALAEAWLAAGQIARARALLDTLLGEEPLLAEAHDLRGQLALGVGELERAVTEARRAAALDPFTARYRYNLGLALQAAGQPEQATAAYRAALRLEPGHAVALNNLGLLAATRGDWAAAADRYVDALQAAPDYAEAAHNLGLALRALHRPREAIGAFCLAVRLRPGLSAARRALGQLGSSPQRCSR